ncbi:MAG: lipopolysaccharide heptosyltransferase II, partial [Deltaproteobacteria bacterium]|nr:lipopolysaccharide heptosyltransferase II [Deltaproteobacteria bacterium]
GADVSLDKPHPVPDVRVGEADIFAAKAILEKNNVKPGTVLIGIAPGASFGPSKRWKLEGFKEVAKRCAKEFGALPVIFGGGEDAVVADKLSAILDVRHLNLAGKTKLKEFFALAKMMDAFVTNDSGPMHVAAALGTPTVGMFGWTEPSLTGALGNKVKYISKNVDCKLCHKRECPYGHHKCMDISPEEVYAEVKAFLVGKEKGNG